MFDSSIINVIVGLLLIFLLYSLLATIIQEIIATNLNMRGSTLRKSIRQMLDGNDGGKELSQLFYKHPLIRSLTAGRIYKKPSYLNGGSFSKVVVDMLRGKEAKAGDNFAPAIQGALDNSKTQWAPAKITEPANTLLKSLWADSQGDVEKFRTLIENWFNNVMDHASGSYKRKTQLMLFFIGLVLAAIFNIDAIQLAKKLSSNPELAKQLAANASAYLETHKELGTKLPAEPYPVFITNDSSGFKVGTDKNGIGNETVFCSKGDTSTLKISLIKNSYQHQVDSVQLVLAQKSSKLIDSANAMIHSDIANANDLLGLGWNCHGSVNSISVCIKENLTWKSIVGWIITALAISMGAPFWFDLLNKFMKFRGATSKPDDNTGINNREASTDRVG